jgi:hypothetical protein
MTKGNMHEYAPRLPQKSRIPLVCDHLFKTTRLLPTVLKLYDVITGLIYLHGLGVVHTDLKGVCLTFT